VADVHDPQTRSFNMSRVRSRGNATTELRFRQVIREARLTGWRRGYPLFGKPDFVFPAHHLAIFIDGCFWHGCARGCKPLPKDNPFWAKKVALNRKRDRVVTRALRRRGWTVIRIWEHELAERNVRALHRIRRALQSTIGPGTHARRSRSGGRS
jgi:DNA mismatch endonuclease (patch repair protein)